MADAEDKDTPPKAGGSKLGLILTLLNLGLTGFLAAQVMGISGKVAELARQQKAPDAPEAAVKPIATLDPFVVNLNEEGRARYLKAKFDLELKNEAAVAALGERKVMVRDDVLRYLSSLNVAETLGEEGKTRIGDTIRERIDKQLGGGKITRLFFNEFVVQ